MRHLLAVGLVLAVVAPLSAQIEVEHMAYGPDPQFAGDPNQPQVAFTMGWSSWNGRSKPTLLGWGETSNGVAAGLFDKAELQQAIDDTVALYGTWEAVIQVTQVNWVTTPIPLQFTPVVGSADVGSSTGYFAYQGDGSNDHPLLGDGRTSQTHRNAYGAIPAGGQWLDAGGTAQAHFQDAVVAGVGSGASALSIGPSWTQALEWDPDHPAWTISIDATDIVAHYVASDALLLFAGATGDIGVTVFGANQWGGAADIRVEFFPEPVSLALLAMGGLVALRRRR
jgi:hypothetical protein